MSPYSTFDMITAVWLAFVGASIGSFLNVVAYRMPRGISVIWEPSRCPKCHQLIRSYDNVPVLGWLWLRGKCRDCHAPISPRYAIVEFILGAAFFALAYVELFSGGANLHDGPITAVRGAEANVWKPKWKLIGIYAYHGLSLAWLIGIALICIDRQRIPLKLIAFGAALVAFLEFLGRPHLEAVGHLLP